MADEAKEFALAVRAFSTANKESSSLAAATFGKDGAVGKGVDKLVTRLNLQFAADAAKKTKDFIMDRKMKRQEMKMLRDRLGLTKQDFKVMMTTKRNNDAFKKMQESLGTAAENLLGFDESFVQDMMSQQLKDDEGRFISLETAIENNIERLNSTMDANNFLQERNLNVSRRTQQNRAAAEEEQAEANAREERRTSLFESMVEGIGTLNRSFMDGMKKTGKFAFAGLIALIAAPVVALANFFGQLAVEFAYLGRLARGGLNILFKPFAALLRFFPNFNAFLISTGASIRAAAQVIAPQNLGRNIRSVVTTLKNFFEPVTKFFSTIFRNVKTFVNASRTASGILKFAAGFGTVLGKLFLPLTIVMSAFDFITGFIDGFQSEKGSTGEKIFAGFKGGFQKLFKNLIGLPLKLLTNGVAFIAGLFGFDNAKKSLNEFADKIPKFISDLVGAPFDLIKKIFDFDFKSFFTKKFPTLAKVFGGKSKEEERAERIAKLEKNISRRGRSIGRLKEAAETQGKFEPDFMQQRQVERFNEAKKALDAEKAELAALRAQMAATSGGGGATAIDNSRSETSVRSENVMMTNTAIAIPY